MVTNTDVYHFQHNKVKKISKTPSLPHILKLKLSSKVRFNSNFYNNSKNTTIQVNRLLKDNLLKQVHLNI